MTEDPDVIADPSTTTGSKHQARFGNAGETILTSKSCLTVIIGGYHLERVELGPDEKQTVIIHS
jgi:hypothetical protein